MIFPNIKQYFAAFVATLGALTMGWQNSWQGAVMLKLADPDSPVTFETSDISVMAAMYQIGAILGSLTAYFSCNHLGRKFTIVLSALPFVLSTSSMIFIQTLQSYEISRLTNGFACGLITTSTSIYLNEIASPSIRGTVASFYIIQMYVGSLAGFIIIPLVPIEQSAMCMTIPPLLLLALSAWIPESPYFYVVHCDDDDRALASLCQLRGGDVGVAKVELSRMRSHMEKEKLLVKRSRWDFIFNPAGRKAFMLLGIMLFGNIYSGRFTMKIFYQTILQESNSTVSPYIAGITFSIAMCLIMYPYTIFIDKCGRRPMMLFSTFSTAIPLTTMGVYYLFRDSLATKLSPTVLNTVPFTCISLWFVTYALGLEALPFASIGELMATENRGLVSCLLNIYLNVIGSGAVFWHWMIDEHLGHAYLYFTYTGVCFVVGGLLFVYQPETKGKSLEEIQDELNGVGREREVNGKRTV